MLVASNINGAKKRRLLSKDWLGGLSGGAFLAYIIKAFIKYFLEVLTESFIIALILIVCLQ